MGDACATSFVADTKEYRDAGETGDQRCTDAISPVVYRYAGMSIVICQQRLQAFFLLEKVFCTCEKCIETPALNAYLCIDFSDWGCRSKPICHWGISPLPGGLEMPRF